MFTKRELILIELGVGARLRLLQATPTIPNCEEKIAESQLLIEKVREAQR